MSTFPVLTGIQLIQRLGLNNSSTWMKKLLFAAGQYDADILIKKLFFIPVALRRDDSNPSAALFGVRSMSIQLHPACLASGPDLSRELSRLDVWALW
jgi:hypothetical protein